MKFQSDNGTAFVGELNKELMIRSQVAQAHSTTYHPHANALVEKQNWTLVSTLRVYYSRYLPDWDRYLPQVMAAYNSTQHSTTGVSQHMTLTGHQNSFPLIFFYPDYERKKTPPQVYVRVVIRRQQEVNELCRRGGDPKEVEGTLHDHGSAPRGTFLQSEYRSSRSIRKNRATRKTGANLQTWKNRIF